MQILVTGGSGFIGSYFLERLRALGHTSVVLDLVDPHLVDTSLIDRFVKGDVRDPQAVRDAARGCQAVLHLAAAHHDFGIAESAYWSVNKDSAAVLCGVMDELGITNCCFYSTVAVYGEARAPITEDTPPAPTSHYGKSKLGGEQVFAAWCAKDAARRTLVIRPTVTFGPRNYANMYSLIRQIYKGLFLSIGRGDNVKSLSYVENIVDFTLYAWGLRDPNAPPPAPAGMSIFNYIDKPDLSSREIIAQIHSALGKRPKPTIPLWFGLLLALPFDVVIRLTGRNLPISGARVRKLNDETRFEAERVAALGYSAPVPLREGINRMVRWYEETGRHGTPLPPPVRE